MDQREEFVIAHVRGHMSMTELCEAYGISRKTGYKWVERFFAGGLPALADRSRAPHHRPHAVAEEIVEAIVELRKQHRTWGPKKLLICLSRQHPDVQWPAESTVSTILKRQGLVEGRYRRKRTPYATQPLAAATEPNIVWSTDFKGKFRVGRRYCNPLTISDACSRYLLAVDGLDGERFEPTKKVFERVLKEHGLPLRIRSDNGTPFASSAIGGLSRLSVWWICLGIMPERIEPGHPEQNGRHERMHRTLKQETASPPQSSREAQQLAFDRFRHEYNHERPHEALGQETPASRYEPSRRPFPDDVGDPEYPAPFEIRRGSPLGAVVFRRTKVHLGKVLARQAVGIETIDDGKWQLWFGPIYLGLLHERRRGKLSLVKNKPVPPRYSKTSS